MARDKEKAQLLATTRQLLGFGQNALRNVQIQYAKVQQAALLDSVGSARGKKQSLF